jgi:hypothetical protein
MKIINDYKINLDLLKNCFRKASDFRQEHPYNFGMMNMYQSKC